VKRPIVIVGRAPDAVDVALRCTKANMNADGHRRVPSADKGLYVAYALHGS